MLVAVPLSGDMSFKRFIPAVVAVALAVAGCGGSSTHSVSHPVKSPPATQSVQVCSGLTDTCKKVQVPTTPKLIPPTAARNKFPDVAFYQGHPNWNAVKAAGFPGAIAKLGEGNFYDPDFIYNWKSLSTLHMPHGAYWFVRKWAGCATQATLIISRLQSLGYGSDPLALPVQLDIEVPHANDGSLALCIDSHIFAAFHRHAGIYTSPGTWPGGSHGGLTLWQAEYGPLLHTFWSPVVAWQCTDGQFGCVTFVPGIGYDDVSINLGVLGEVIKPGPSPQVLKWREARSTNEKAWFAHHCVATPDSQACASYRNLMIAAEQSLYTSGAEKRVHCFGPSAQVQLPYCKVLRPTVAEWSNERTAAQQAIVVLNTEIKGVLF